MYNHTEIEQKWQKIWDEQGAYKTVDPDMWKGEKKKFYALVEFPYPSGEGLHVGHPRPYIGMDVISRKRRMEGYHVMFPFGFDAFGLPAENFAIKHKIHPAVATQRNIKRFTAQVKSLGLSFDWDRMVDTTDPDYYKWTQWIFLQFFKQGLAYKDSIAINWCINCKIGLANEEVVGGRCERCGGPVEKRLKSQWMLKITAYAERLLNDLNTTQYLEKIKTQQREWIGRSEGVNYQQKVKGTDITLESYDSVPQTFMAQTFAVISPEHQLLPQLIAGLPEEKAVLDFVEKFKQRKLEKGFEVDKESEGIFTGRYLDNPFGTGDLPIWVASFVVADYGTGFVNCSAHDERDFAFAKKYNIPLRVAMLPADPDEAEKVRNLEYCYHHDPEAVLLAPEEFKDKKWGESREDIIHYIEQKGFGYPTTNFKLRDWVFSRQRYWGEPIPIISCEKCGFVAVPEKDLPVRLPEVEKYEPTDTGESPLAVMTDWVNVDCPQCGGPAKRETDTMPNWAGSSWYFLRYIDPKNSQSFADFEKLKYWMPVDWYNGGMEHTTLHLLYSRFWNKFLFDMKDVPTSEPYQKRTSHGMILGEGGEKMSKSKGNVVNPDDIVAQYGADTLRLYEMFMGPFDQAIPWDIKGLEGCYRFIQKVLKTREDKVRDGYQDDRDILRSLHKIIRKVGSDIETMGFNTAVSAGMIFMNEVAKKEAVSKQTFEQFLTIMAPFIPHITEELWQRMGHATSIFKESWPVFDPELAKDDEIELVIQINGKVRGKLMVSPDISKDAALEMAHADEGVKKWLDGKTIKNEVFVPGKIISIVVA